MINISSLIIFVLSLAGLLFFILKNVSKMKAIPLENNPKLLKDRIKSLKPNIDTDKLVKKTLFKTREALRKGEKWADKSLKKVTHSQKFKEDYWDKVD